MAASLPLVSCLCVTRNKPHKLRRALRCFNAQTYPNRELVLVVESDDEASLALLAEQSSDFRSANVLTHIVSAVPKLTLGDLRNVSIDVCNGEYFCQWDDDDWYHRERIAVQMEGLAKSHQAATLLTYWFMFETGTRQAYLSPNRLWEGSILCRKSVLDAALRYPALPRMEDTVFVNALAARVGIFPQVAPSLYIYEVHENNTWNAKHFKLLLSVSQALPRAASELIAGVMGGQYSPEQAARVMDSKEILQEARFYQVNDVPSNDELAKYRAYMAEG